MSEEMKKVFAALVTRTSEDAHSEAIWRAGEIFNIESDGDDDEEYYYRCDRAFANAFKEIFGISWYDAEEYYI